MHKYKYIKEAQAAWKHSMEPSDPFVPVGSQEGSAL